MKRLILYLLFFSINCFDYFGQSTNQKSSEFWIENGYLNCIKENQPCECPQSNPSYYIEFRTDSIDSLFFNGGHRIVNFQKSENISFDIIDIMLSYRENTDSIVGHIEIEKDSLFYHDKSNEMLFIYTRINSQILFKIENIFSIKYLNELLISNGNNDLNTILKTDTLSCGCNNQLGYNTCNNGDKSWIIEIQNNEIIIYRLKIIKIKRFTKYRKSMFPHKRKKYKSIKLKQ